MTRCQLFITLILGMGILPAQAEELTGTWRFCNGPEFPGALGQLHVDAGRATLKYAFSGGGNYVAAYCDLTDPLPLRSLRFRLEKPRDASITIRAFDAANQCFQKSLAYDDSRPRDVEVSLRDWASHWGGPNDGILRPPIRTVGILVEHQGLSVDRGSITFDTPLVDRATSEELALAGSGGGPRPCSYLVTDFGSDCVLARSAGDTLSDGVWRVNWRSARPASLTGSLSLFHRPARLTIRARASAPGATLTVHIGAHFQNFQRTVGVFDGTDQTFTFTLPPDGWQASGAAHETLHYPLRITRLAIDRGQCASERLDIALDSITCETTVDPGSAAIFVSRLSATPTREDQRDMTIRCTGWNLLDAPLPGTLHVQATTWDGTVLHQAEWPIQLEGGGRQQTWEHAFSVPADRRYVETVCRFESAGQRAAESSSTFTAPLADDPIQEWLPEPDRAVRPESPWGMGVYLYRYPHNESGLRQMDRAAQLAADAGVKWTREEFNYGMIERSPRVYDFRFFDTLVDTAHRHGISVYALLSYWSPFVAPYTEEGIEAYCHYAQATVRRYKDRIKHWEIYNEPNIFFWNGPKELYPVLLERVYRVIKEEDPTARVLGISTAGIDRPFIRMVLESGAPFDDLTIHPYRGQLIESNFIRELQQTATLVDNRPVWITEMGWSTQVAGGKSEREQAQLLARSYLAAVGAGVRNMGWYNFRNDGDDPFYNEANFGVLRRDLTPKAAYRALATVCRTLAAAGSHGPDWLENGRGERGLYALTAGGNTALWTSETDLEVTVAVSGGPATFLNLMGEPLEAVGLEPAARSQSSATPALLQDRPKPAESARRVLSLRRGEPVFFVGERLEVVTVQESTRNSDDEGVLRF